MPVAQLFVHAEDDRPSIAPKAPATQETQVVFKPETEEYLPAGHLRHCVVATKVPAGQVDAHESEPDGEYFPVAQAAQAVDVVVPAL